LQEEPLSLSELLRRPLRVLSVPLALLLLYGTIQGAAGIFSADAVPLPVPIEVDGPVALPVPAAYQTLEDRIGVALDQPYNQLKKPDGSPLDPSQPPEILDMGFDAYPPAVAARGAGLRWMRVAADLHIFVRCEGATLRWNDYAFAEYRELYRRAFAAQMRLEIVINQGRRSLTCLPRLGENGSIEPFLVFARAIAQQTKEVRAQFSGDPRNQAAAQPLVYHIFNEPNNGGEPLLGKDPELFARVVHETTLAIRATDPSAHLVSGGFGGGETAARGAPIDILDYVRRFIVAYRARLPAAALVPRQTPGLVDAIGYNPYGDQNNIAWLRKQLDVAGFGALPIDAAEWGIHNDDSNSDVIANSLEASEDLRLQTVFLLNTLEKPVRNIMIWTLRRSYLEPDKRRTAGLVDEVEDAVDTPNQTDISCTEAGAYSNIAGVSGYFCRPKMYALATLLRVSEDRRLVGSLLSSRDELGQQQPGNGGVHAIKFEGGGPYGLDDVIAVWCPRTDSDGCAFQFSKRPVAALDRVGRWIDHTAGVFKTDELAGVQYYFFSHPAPPVSPTPDVPAAVTATASALEPTTPLATPRSTPFPTALATPIPTPYEPPPGPVCPTYLNCVFMPGVRRF
jgi:hypothetical protein